MVKNIGILAILILGLFGKTYGETIIVYVDNSFKGSGKGTKEMPFKAIEDALTFAKDIKFRGNAGNAIHIAILEGTYFLKNTINIQEINRVPIKIYALAKNSVSISGGTILENKLLQPYNGPQVSGKKYYYYKYPLKKSGLNDYGTINSYGFRRPYYPSNLELFIDNSPFHLARYPNKNDMLPMGKVIETGSNPAYLDFSNKDGEFVVESDRLEKWKQEKNGWVGGYFAFAWADDAFKIKNIDLKNKSLRTDGAAMFGFVSGFTWSKFYVYNMLSELDFPGEYFVDEDEGVLYFCTSDPINENNITISMLESPLFSIKRCSNLSIENLTFEHTRGMAVYMEGGENCSIKSCTFRNIGMVGVVIGQGIEPFEVYKEKGTGKPVSDALGSWHEHLYNNPTFFRNAGTNNGIDSCHFYNIGMGAVSLGGGDRVKLKDAGNYVTNSKMHHFNRLGKTYKAGINVDGCGNIIKNNEIFEAEHSAIYIHGNNHLIESNNIHKCCTDTEDMGAIYMGRDPSEAGNIIRGNYFHDIVPAKENYRVAAIFLDDGASYVTIDNNIFENCGDKVFGASYSNSGQFLTYTNNLFLNCNKAIGYYTWDKTRWNNYYDIDIWQERLFKFVNIKTEPYKSRYPGLGEKLRDHTNPPIVKNCIMINCKTIDDGNVIKTDNLITNNSKYLKLQDDILSLHMNRIPSWGKNIKINYYINKATISSRSAGNPYSN